ncbi:alpha/beta fold hydrolase [Bauldia sp.]|uniref:alpha/beta fold hydrolase n=1 Tax=Bauldia sp. TaxID=2575872 RepID=UPI003BABE12A
MTSTKSVAPVMALLVGALLWSQPLSANEVPGPRHTIAPHLFEGDDGKPVAAEWGRLVVPENRTDPPSNLIEVPFVRFRSNAPDPSEPYVFLSGGPGEESLGDNIRQFLPFVADLPFDLILVEQRGVGHSRPRLDCADRYDLARDRPLDRATLRAAEREHARACAAFWADKGVDLTGYNAREMASDVDALRRALGYDKINLLGGSFGSHHGLAVLRGFEDTVHRAVLSAVEGPDHTVKLPSTIQSYLDTLDAMVRADPDLSAHIPSLLELMATVLDQLEAEPVTVTIVDPETGDAVAIVVGKLDLQLMTAAGLGRTDFLKALPRRYHAMANGDFSWLGAAALDYRTNRGGALMGTLVDCASGASADRRARIAAEAEDTLLGGAINGVQFDICDVIGSADLGPDFRADLESDVPVLLVSAGLDPRTPVGNAKEVGAGLADSHHLIIDGVSHDFAMGDERLSAYIAMQVAFLSGQPPETTRIAVPFAFDPIANR